MLVNQLSSAYGAFTAMKSVENAIKKHNAGGVGVYYVNKNKVQSLGHGHVV